MHINNLLLFSHLSHGKGAKYDENKFLCKLLLITEFVIGKV